MSNNFGQSNYYDQKLDYSNQDSGYVDQKIQYDNKEQRLTFGNDEEQKKGTGNKFSNISGGSMI